METHEYLKNDNFNLAVTIILNKST